MDKYFLLAVIAGLIATFFEQSCTYVGKKFAWLGGRLIPGYKGRMKAQEFLSHVEESGAKGILALLQGMYLFATGMCLCYQELCEFPTKNEKELEAEKRITEVRTSFKQYLKQIRKLDRYALQHKVLTRSDWYLLEKKLNRVEKQRLRDWEKMDELAEERDWPVLIAFIEMLQLQDGYMSQVQKTIRMSVLNQR